MVSPHYLVLFNFLGQISAQKKKNDKHILAHIPYRAWNIILALLFIHDTR